MNRWFMLALASTMAAFGNYSASTAGSAPFANPPVELQPATPGTAQTGHANITGKLIAADLSATDATASGVAIFGFASSASGANYGGLFKSASASGRAIRGYNTSTSGAGIGGDFQSDGPGGIALKGISTSTTGGSYGGYFSSASTTGYGVRGISAATSGANYGGFFQNASPAGNGVYGIASASSGGTFGVHGRVNSTVGTAVFGESAAGTGANFGVYGQNQSTGGYGVVGYAKSLTGGTYGGFFDNLSTGGVGAFGRVVATTGTTYGGYFTAASTSARGAMGVATAATGTTYGLVGATSSPSGFGVYSNGVLGGSGTKPFRIDHPLDPENKYLFHYSSEGPEPLNVYSGNIVTDSQGRAWVQLPNYFGEINKNPRYQLTVLSDGNDFVQAMVSKKIANNRFQIHTSRPNIEVSWRIEATRNDRFVQAYGAPVEVDKTDSERGTYQRPELYGKPKEMGTFYRAEEERLTGQGETPLPER